MTTDLGYVEGDTCNRDGCKGAITMHPVENCSCHLHAPCSACTDVTAFCPECGWEESDDPLCIREISTIWLGPIPGVERRKRVLDPTKIDYRIEMHSSASQKVIGVYPEGTTASEVEARVRGTFGGRFNHFGHGRFEYIAYTD